MKRTHSLIGFLLLGAGAITLTSILSREKLGSATSSVSREMTAPSVVDATVTLNWNPNPEPDIAGYKVYKGISPHLYGTAVNVGNVTTATLTNLTPGVTYYIAISAYNAAQFEGNLSNEISYSILSPSPTPATATISGTVSYCLGGLLDGVPVGVSNGVTVLTGNGGQYVIPLPQGANYTVGPSTAMAHGTAIDTLDIVIIQKQFLGLVALGGCRLEAGDVNQDGRIDTVDAVAVQRFFLGMTIGTGRAGEFRFTPTNRVYTPLTSDQPAQDYLGTRFGDVIP